MTDDTLTKLLAEPWAPPDLATEPTQSGFDSALIGVMSIIKHIDKRLNAMEVYMREMENRIDILMQNDARLDTLEAVVGELRRE